MLISKIDKKKLDTKMKKKLNSYLETFKTDF